MTSPDQYGEWMSIDSFGKMTEEDICASTVNRGHEDDVEDENVDFAEEDEGHTEPVYH